MTDFLAPFDGDLLQSAVRLSIPLALAAVGETVAERTGMLNIGLEGMILSGALGAILGGHLTGDPLLGVFIGALSGALLSAIAALFMITLRADQVVVGVGLVLFAQGLTTLLFRQFLPQQSQVGPLRSYAIPGLSDIPLLGPALFNQNALAYTAYVLIAATAFVLTRTSWGLFVRAAGQAPRALDSAGHSVTTTRWCGMAFAGAMAGLAGAYLSVGQLGTFNENMSAGRGYIALAAVVFGGWAVWKVVGACLVFGGVNALQLRLQAIGGTPESVWRVVGIGVAIVAVAIWISEKPVRRPSPRKLTVLLLAAGAIALAIAAPVAQLPSQIYTALPYICALAVLAGFGRTRAAPAALTIPYDRASR